MGSLPALEMQELLGDEQSPQERGGAGGVLAVTAVESLLHAASLSLLSKPGSSSQMDPVYTWIQDGSSWTPVTLTTILLTWL